MTVEKVEKCCLLATTHDITFHGFEPTRPVWTGVCVYLLNRSKTSLLFHGSHVVLNIDCRVILEFSVHLLIFRFSLHSCGFCQLKDSCRISLIIFSVPAS